MPRLLWFAAFAFAGVPCAGEAPALPLSFSCAPNNDLYRVLEANGIRCPRFAAPAEAVGRVAAGGAVAILADRYPASTTPLTPDLLAEAARKKLRVYIEYPSWLPDIETAPPREAEWERGVVASNAFAPALERLRILALHRCRFVPLRTPRADLVLARVAGFDTAVYGLPEEDVYPVLFEHPRGDLLVATTKLSQFVTARYAPASAWTAVWKHVLSWLCPGRQIPELRWAPLVAPSFARAEAIGTGAEREAFRRGVTWFARAGLLPGSGDGSEGVAEGLSSAVRYDGTQPVSKTVRADCTGEVSMSLAFSRVLDGNVAHGTASRNLNDFLYFKSPLAGGPRDDARSPSSGLLGWSLPEAAGVYYGDDNARAMLGTMAASALLKESRWDELLLRCLLANLRTSGTSGFRRSRLEEAQLRQLGWRHYYAEDRPNYAPHYEAYLWACFLWAYDKTRFAPFLDRARTAIRMTMEGYPAEWHWTNGIQQERARLLLPLAWLIRVEDRPEHRQWLRRIAQDLLALQDPSGAIREEVGSAGLGSYWPPKSNQEYGTREAPLLQRNGDPVSDLLYTSNFAFLGLHETAQVDRSYAAAEARLAQFLCRIQVRSAAHPELDGAWFRAFDYRRWEYWGSNADLGWGAWSVETGWTQSWITSVLAMRQMSTSLWQLTASSRVAEQAPKLIPAMFPSLPR